MSDYSSLKATINANIKANNNHEITGAITNSVLNAMVNSLGAGYQFIGVATPTNPGSAQTPDYKCFYLATTPGTYTNLGGLVVADGEVAILKYDTSWTKEVTGIATAESVSQLGQEKANTEDLIDIIRSANRLNVNDPDVEDGKSINKNGVLSEKANFITSGYIYVGDRPNLSFWYYNTAYENISANAARYIAAFDANKNVIPEYGSNDGGTTYNPAPEVVKYLRLSFYKSYWSNINLPMVVVGTTAPSHYISYSETEKIKDSLLPQLAELNDEITDVEANKADKDALYETIASTNLLNVNDADFGLGFINASTGVVGSSSSIYTTGYIEIEPNQDYVLGNDAQLYNVAAIRAWAVFDANKSVISSAGNADGVANGRFNISASNAKYIRLSIMNTYVLNGHLYLNKGSNRLAYEPYWRKIIVKNSLLDINHIGKTINAEPSKYLRWTGSISDGDTIVLGVNYDVKLNKHCEFKGRLGTFDRIVIGHGLDIETGVPTKNKVAIDNTNIYIYSIDYSATPIAVAHGLTIENTFTIKLDKKNQNGIDITIISNGNEFVYHSEYLWYGNCGSIFVTSSGTSLTLCDFSWTCGGFNAPIHIYGDSYLGVVNPNRWPYYLIRDGFSNCCLLDGWGGRTAAQGYASFANIIQHSRPKYAVWLLGINNPDSTTAVNESWWQNTNLFLQKCDELGVIPILCLCPQLPSRDNSFKNAWIRSSDRRYVDFETPVGSDISSSWYSGMLSDDNLHPTDKGAIELYSQFLADFPEVMCFR